MQIFLGDYVSLLNDSLRDKSATVVSGQITGIVLDDDGSLQFVYIAGIDSPFWMHDGWKFVDSEDDDD